MSNVTTFFLLAENLVWKMSKVLLRILYTIKKKWRVEGSYNYYRNDPKWSLNGRDYLIAIIIELINYPLS